jgi:hypothetical protein
MAHANPGLRPGLSSAVPTGLSMMTIGSHADARRGTRGWLQATEGLFFFPSQRIRDLTGQAQGIKGLGQNGGHRQVRERAVVDGLHFCRQQHNGDVAGGAGGPELAQHGRSVHGRHHHVEQDGVRLMLLRAFNRLRSAVGLDHFPARHDLQTLRGRLP